MRDLLPEDAGLYQVDVEDVNMFSTDFKSTFYIWIHNTLITLTELIIIIRAYVTNYLI